MTTVLASRLRALLCALLLVGCTLAAYPFAETGFNDDFSYIYSAKALAETGHIHYVGWASAMLGWQLPLGAAFIKVFGFSFSAVRFSTLLISAMTAFLLHRVFVRFGLREGNAFLAALTVVLSPLFLALAFSFMSDVSGVFVLVVCMYSCLRSVQASTDRAAFAWLAFACVGNAVGGTARQTAWLGLMFMVPSTFYLIRHRKPPLVAAAVIWVLSLAFMYGSLRWFSHQLYSLIELPIAGYIDRDLIYALMTNVYIATFEVFLFALPVIVVFAGLFPWGNRRVAGSAGALAALFFVAGVVLRAKHKLLPLLAPFDLGGNFVSPRGLVNVPEIGIRPMLMPAWLQLVVTVVTFAAALGLLGFLLGRAPARTVARLPGEGAAPPTWKQTFYLTGPVTLSYLALLLHRALFDKVYDRYLLPVLVVVLILVIRLYQDRVATALPRLCYGVLTVYALFGIAGVHDAYAERRARVSAGQRLVAAGVPRTAFYNGFEYDDWTQIEAMGFVNSGYMLMPDGLHKDKPVPRRMTVKPCDDRFAQNAPAIQPKYGVSFDQAACDGPSGFAPEAYRAWLPPFHRELYIRSVTRPAF